MQVGSFEIQGLIRKIKLPLAHNTTEGSTNHSSIGKQRWQSKYSQTFQFIRKEVDISTSKWNVQLLLKRLAEVKIFKITSPPQRLEGAHKGDWLPYLYGAK